MSRPRKRKTVMVRCKNPECYELAPEDIGYCSKCVNTRPHKCADCDTIIHGKAVCCDVHKAARKAATHANWQAKVRADQKAARDALKAKPKPRKKPELTEEQITRLTMKHAKECREQEQRLAQVRQTLNPQLLAARMLGRAVCNYMGG